MTVPDVVRTQRELAGYRVLRSLARDDQAELLLGFREPSEEAALRAYSGTAPASVALKVMPATAEIWRQMVPVVEALDRARGEHVVELLDVEADDDTICLIFERLPRGDLAELLRLRQRLDAGEAVTLLAPLAATVSRLHRAGVAHGALTARAILFRDDGAPVLIAFGHATLFAPGSPEVVLEREAGVLADRTALRELSAAVLSRVTGSRARAAQALLAEVEGCADDLVLGVLAVGIFGVAAAVPVRFAADESAAQTEVPRIVPIGAPVSADWPASRPEARILSRLVPDAWVQRVLDGVDGSPVAPVVAAATRRWRAWSPRRRRVVLGVVAALVGVLLAMAVVPPGGSSAHGSAASNTGGPGVPAPSRSTASDASPGPTERADIAGDDPIAAAVALIVSRDRCLRSLSSLCLDEVDQQDSTALRTDRGSVSASQQGGEAPGLLGGGDDGGDRAGGGGGGLPVLVERLGDSALVRLARGDGESEPASLLLVKSEAGWRIRDVIAAPTPGTTGAAQPGG